MAWSSREDGPGVLRKDSHPPDTSSTRNQEQPSTKVIGGILEGAAEIAGGILQFGRRLPWPFGKAVEVVACPAFDLFVSTAQALGSPLVNRVDKEVDCLLTFVEKTAPWTHAHELPNAFSLMFTHFGKRGLFGFTADVWRGMEPSVKHGAFDIVAWTESSSLLWPSAPFLRTAISLAEPLSQWLAEQGQPINFKEMAGKTSLDDSITSLGSADAGDDGDDEGGSEDGAESELDYDMSPVQTFSGFLSEEEGIHEVVPHKEVETLPNEAELAGSDIMAVTDQAGKLEERSLSLGSDEEDEVVRLFQSTWGR